jgi:hypothetical protein
MRTRLSLHLNNVLAFILQMMPPHLVDFPLRNEPRVDDATVAVPVLMMRKIVRSSQRTAIWTRVTCQS